MNKEIIKILENKNSISKNKYMPQSVRISKISIKTKKIRKYQSLYYILIVVVLACDVLDEEETLCREISRATETKIFTVER